MTPECLVLKDLSLFLYVYIGFLDLESMYIYEFPMGQCMTWSRNEEKFVEEKNDQV